jgi:hypothetical protein
VDASPSPEECVMQLEIIHEKEQDCAEDSIFNEVNFGDPQSGKMMKMIIEWMSDQKSK